MKRAPEVISDTLDGLFESHSRSFISNPCSVPYNTNLNLCLTTKRYPKKTLGYHTGNSNFDGLDQPILPLSLLVRSLSTFVPRSNVTCEPLCSPFLYAFVDQEARIRVFMD